jgi:hypothetical protein
VSTDLSIEETYVLNLLPNSQLKRSDELIKKGIYTIIILIHTAHHYSFAVLRLKNKDDPVRWEYYNSLSREPP